MLNMVQGRSPFDFASMFGGGQPAAGASMAGAGAAGAPRQGMYNV